MKILRRSLVAVALTMLVALGFTGIAGAQVQDGVPYNPVICIGDKVLQGDTCVDALVQQRVNPVSAPAVAAVSAAGTLPYTGSNETRPLAEAGVALLAAGGLAVVMVRRHQTS